MDATAGAALRVGHLTDLGRLADAEREARTALAAEPQSPALLAALSRVFLQARKHAAGLAAADSAAAQAPGDERVHRLRALHLSGLGRHRDAAGAAHAAVMLAPQEPLTAVTQARVLQHARLFADALTVARRAVALDPNAAQTHLVLADIADDAGDRRLARAAYEEVLRLDPQHAVARHDLALLDARARRPVAALAGLVEAGTLDPSLPVVLRSMVAVLWQLVTADRPAARISGTRRRARRPTRRSPWPAGPSPGRTCRRRAGGAPPTGAAGRCTTRRPRPARGRARRSPPPGSPPGSAGCGPAPHR